MNIISFTIPGPPKGKGRPRARVIPGKNGKRGFATMYTPKDTVQYENLAVMAFNDAAPGHIPIDSPLSARIVATWPIPKSMTKKKRALIANGELQPGTKPDLDNVAKCILDALNKIAYRDDSLIHTLHVQKIYGDYPHVKVELYWEGSE